MAAKLSGGSVDKFKLSQNCQINLTPFVGVMLLLLVVFMATAPGATASLKVEMPVGHGGIDDRIGDPVLINVEDDNRLFIGPSATTIKTLAADVGTALGGLSQTDQHVTVRAAPSVPYKDFIVVMNTLKSAGYEDVGLIIEEF